MENKCDKLADKMETLRRELSGVSDILKVILDGACEEDTTLERVVNAVFAVDNYLDILVKRMEKEIWKMYGAKGEGLLEG